MIGEKLRPLTAEQQQLAADNAGLIWLALRKYAGGCCDLYSVAAEGLCRAATDYDPARGRFSTFAMWKMRSALGTAQRTAKCPKRYGKHVVYMDDNDTAAHTGSAWSKRDTGRASAAERPVYEMDDTGVDVQRFLSWLPPRVQQVVRLSGAGYSCREIGARLGISGECARQDLLRARRKWELYGKERNE